MVSKKRILEIKNKEERKLLNKENVIGVAIGHKYKKGKNTKRKCLTILVREKLPESQLKKKHKVPKKINDVETDIIEIGDIIVHSKLIQQTKIRPLQMGISIGNIYERSSGTAGCIVRKKTIEYKESYEELPEKLSILRGLNITLEKTFGAKIMKIVKKPITKYKEFILTNNHVAALGSSDKSRIGNPIVQPGLYDLNNPNNVIGKVYDYIPVKSGYNKVDCALIETNVPYKEEIMKIGKIKGTSKVKIGDKIKKFGRTTSYTEGTVKMINATVRVSGYSGKTLTFTNQCIATKMSAPGDSGSALLNMNNKIVGLLFAGSDKVTIFTPIQNVFSLLNIFL